MRICWSAALKQERPLEARDCPTPSDMPAGRFPLFHRVSARQCSGVHSSFGFGRFLGFVQRIEQHQNNLRGEYLVAIGTGISKSLALISRHRVLGCLRLGCGMVRRLLRGRTEG